MQQVLDGVRVQADRAATHDPAERIWSLPNLKSSDRSEPQPARDTDQQRRQVTEVHRLLVRARESICGAMYTGFPTSRSGIVYDEGLLPPDWPFRPFSARSSAADGSAITHDAFDRYSGSTEWNSL